MFRTSSRRQPPQAGLFDLLAVLFTLSFLTRPALVSAQFLVNGQIFTNALAIVDAPAPNSTFHAGANMPIAIDVSGDGKLQTAAQAPNSGLDTSFDSLELYLVSASQKMNLTITSNGTGFLQQEPGSTVKHLDFQLSNCIPAGEYNFTVYEASHINGTACYTITSYPVAIQNTNFNGTCESGTNALQTLPQASSPPSSNPLLDTSTLTPLNVNFANAGAPGKTVSWVLGLLALLIPLLG
ncbi:hypothetical protein PENSPDRAFT_645130 [Peniophora sp. CONT]|nr:hypothetical protein PENSPDRAFT_645130 [Peniophora sp. CONT]